MYTHVLENLRNILHVTCIGGNLLEEICWSKLEPFKQGLGCIFFSGNTCSLKYIVM